MKKITTILAAILLTTSVFAQSPEKMSYQAVVRNGSNALVTSTAVGMQISILQGSSSGTAVYVETQTPTSNANGLVSIEIGSGTVVSGTFSAIDWSNGPYFIKTETDPTGGTSYTITGTSQLLSVPYALHAKTAETITGTITETDPVYTSSQAANITATDITHLSNLSGTNTGDQNLSSFATKTALGDSIAQVRSEIPSAGGGVLAFAEFYAMMPNDNTATVASGASVEFPQDGPVSGTITRLTSNTFQLAAIGTYRVNWQVSISEAGQLDLVLNGTEIPYTVVGRATGTSQITGNCLITTTSVNSILSLNNPSGSSTALTVTPFAGGTNPVSATLVITRIQ
ncbi:MAG TPA: hypothetical protein VNG53_09980 [Bacteroidia bacterium]|nr:hypothetical protein [Bacteroidia bacterium]